MRSLKELVALSRHGQLSQAEIAKLIESLWREVERLRKQLQER
jgi:hypothetical protein